MIKTDYLMGRYIDQSRDLCHHRETYKEILSHILDNDHLKISIEARLGSLFRSTSDRTLVSDGGEIVLSIPEVKYSKNLESAADSMGELEAELLNLRRNITAMVSSSTNYDFSTSSERVPGLRLNREYIEVTKRTKA